MKHLPTGRMRTHDKHIDLVYNRILPLDRDDAWAAVTGPEPLGDIEVTVIGESEPDHLAVRLDTGTVVDAYLRTREDSTTDMQLVIHDVTPADVGEQGPRGDYLLGVLGARIVDEPEPVWTDYYPAGRAYYDTLADLEEDDSDDR
ncbi:hypothetical protein KV102_15755 [Mumia sp. zg.B53]|uniref:hypothetical protein n=1 Tax=unclassified Mumia TaxID=2621872 RepID=UPI001C6EA900|nr:MULTISPECIES: hypothetical protein [unclassified Mumia]MBW9205664.1 hypothetical protein [Mumia sp. zg.B17]MBW9208334.1 hypothetical protein [Mumia sp. zg.B21]MBW9216292.1 hypothetical protein [Mumia sp. zg.B53]MDD9347719.1 hypothetical protein [Mumia sp.]